MSKAFRCDRCKGYFDPYQSLGEFATIPEYEIADAKRYSEHCVTDTLRNIDLCPGCHMAFLDFMGDKFYESISE